MSTGSETEWTARYQSVTTNDKIFHNLNVVFRCDCGRVSFSSFEQIIKYTSVVASACCYKICEDRARIAHVVERSFYRPFLTQRVQYTIANCPPKQMHMSIATHYV